MHRNATEKDRAPFDRDGMGYRPDHFAGTPCGNADAERERIEAEWYDAWVARGMPFEGVVGERYAAPPRRIANVRRSARVARWCALAALTLLVLVTLVGVAMVWE